MKFKIPLSITGLIALTTFACKQTQPVNGADEAASLKQTEIEFSNRSLRDGFGAALVAYADTDVVKLNDGQFPILGKEALTRAFSGMKPPFKFTIQWKPLKAEVAKSADLGYTYGNWEMKTKTGRGQDTSLYGNYVTVWKKQPDGRWKFVLDGGNNTPKPGK